MARKIAPDDIPHLLPPRRRPPRTPTGILGALRSSFFTGAIVLVPLGVTFWLIWWLTGWIDGWVMPLVPARWHPDRWLGINPRGIGVIIIVLFTMLIGWIARGYLGRSMIRNAEQVVDRMPIVRSVYGGLKQISETILTPGDAKFDRACLVEYPRRGSYRIGLISGPARGEMAEIDGIDDRILSVFLPNTPNATTGFLIYVAEREVLYLDMSIEDAAKLVISAGLVYPGSVENKAETS